MITKHGWRAAVVVVSIDDLESLEETLDVMGRPKLLVQIRDSLAESQGQRELIDSHEPRHTATTPAIASGADVTVAQQMLGHASAAFTLHQCGHLFGGRLDTSPTGWPLPATPRQCGPGSQSGSSSCPS